MPFADSPWLDRGGDEPRFKLVTLGRCGQELLDDLLSAGREDQTATGECDRNNALMTCLLSVEVAWFALKASDGLAQWSEHGSELGREELRLFPGSEVPAFREALVIDELRVGSFRPTPRGRIDLVRKGAHRHRYGDAFRGEEEEARSSLVMAHRPSRSDRNAALSSSVKIIGCSHAAKWPPLSARW